MNMRAFYGKFALEGAAFVCGALVMVYELIGSRVVSPFIGTSTYVWTSLIGVILAALSLGYWVGGRMADKRPDIKVLYMTGYTRNAIIHHGRLDPDIDLLTKPFTAEALARKIRHILDARALAQAEPQAT